jgi:hypothetical protein
LKTVVACWCVLSLLTACGATPAERSKGSGSGGSAPSGGSAGSGSPGVGGAGGTLGSAGSGTGGGGASTGGTTSGGTGGSGGSTPGIGVEAPPETWVNATGNLAGMASDCLSLGKVAAKPDSNRVLAGVAGHGVWASDDAGATWVQLGTGAGSAVITNRTSLIAFDPEHTDTIWEAGSHNGGGFFRSTDGGDTFVQLGTMTMSQDAAFDFADPDRKTIVTGTHGKGVFRTTDGGQTFTDVGTELATNTLWTYLFDAETHLIGLFDGDAPGVGVARTTDGGDNWTQVSELAPSHDGGFTHASDGSLYYSLNGNQGFAKSTDQGLTWAKIAAAGATFPPPFFTITLVELPDGSLVYTGADHVMRTTDGGASFAPIGEPLPYAHSGSNFGGLTYAAQTKTFYLWHSECNPVVLDDAIMSAGFDWE